MEPVLAKFCRHYFVGFYEDFSSLEEAAGLGLRGLLPDEKRELAPILDEITGQRYSADDLLKLWNSSPADVHFRDGEAVRALFKFARKKIG